MRISYYCKNQGRCVAVCAAILVLLVVSLVICCNRYYLLWWNANSIRVEANAPLSGSRVKILQDGRLKFDGRILESIDNYYGENDFVVLYDNRKQFKFRHFKKNRRNQHAYRFQFFQTKEEIRVRVTVKGFDAMDIEGRLSPIP